MIQTPIHRSALSGTTAELITVTSLQRLNVPMELMLNTYSGGVGSTIWFGYKSTGTLPPCLHQTGGCDLDNLFNHRGLLMAIRTPALGPEDIGLPGTVHCTLELHGGKPHAGPVRVARCATGPKRN